MTRGGARIALIERPINQAIEKHRRRACKNHADRRPATMFATRAGHSRPRQARREQMEAQKPCGKNESAGETAPAVRRSPIFASPCRSFESTSSDDSKIAIQQVAATGRSPRIKSASRARKASAQLCKSEVFAMTAAFLFIRAVLPGRKVKPYGSKLISASPTISVPSPDAQ